MENFSSVANNFNEAVSAMVEKMKQGPKFHQKIGILFYVTISGVHMESFMQSMIVRSPAIQENHTDFAKVGLFRRILKNMRYVLKNGFFKIRILIIWKIFS